MAVLRSLVRWASGGALLLLMLAAWEIFARFIFPRFEPTAQILFPPPSSAIRDGVALILQGSLFQHALASMKRVFIGFGVAVVIAIPVGLAMGLSETVRNQLTPITGILRPIPPVAWIPISLLWFGVTDTQQYYIIFIGTLFPVLLNTIAGVESLDPIVKRAALSLGADRRAMFGVVLRGALPSIFLGIRTSLGFGWFIIVAAEIVSAPNGLGFLILEGRNAIITERIYVGMFAIGILNFLQNEILLRLKSRLMPWD